MTATDPAMFDFNVPPLGPVGMGGKCRLRIAVPVLPE